jgi:hypothetical protein
MATYGAKAILVDNAVAAVVGNSETNLPVSKVEQLTCDDSRDMYIIAECSGVAGGAGTLKLQESHRKDGTFSDVAGATVTVTADGTFEIEINEIDGAGSALKPYIRVVATTGGADAMTIDRLYKTVRRLA